MMRFLLTSLGILQFLAACSLADNSTPTLVLSVVGTNDVHGNLSQREDRGGLSTISGYVGALRSARDKDDGGVLLIDAGDMWQGTLESNMTEGAAIVAAYNELGYAAAAIGNHEFDFGPLGPDATPTSPSDDPRGALKQRANEADFPLLAANLIDIATDLPVSWPNVRSSIMVETNGLNVGIIGVMAQRALLGTIASNVVGLRVAPLVPAIEKEARALRDAGADLIIVTAHAGGRCANFDDPLDLSSCNEAGEIFEVARSLPPGLVDHIIAGHVHQGIAHVVNGIAITASFANTHAFSRVDFILDRGTHDIIDKKIFQPTRILSETTYEGQAFNVDSNVAAIAERASQFARDKRNQPLGIYLATAFTLDGNPESTLGNLFTDALLDSFDADVAIHNVAGGLRRDLPPGDATFGSVYEMSPFENRVVVIALSGAQLRHVVATQALRGSRRMGFSGMRVFVSCKAGAMAVVLRSDNGSDIADDDQLNVIVNDYLALGGDGILAAILPDDGLAIDPNMPLSRDTFINWLAEHGGSINASEYDTSRQPKWNLTQPLAQDCRYPGLMAK